MMRRCVAVLAGCVGTAIVAALLAQSSVLSRPVAAAPDAVEQAREGFGYEPRLPTIPAPEIDFTDIEGKPVTLADKRGKLVLLNVWATWCPPCVREMPSLDRLQAALGGPGFEVVALSEDRAGAPVVAAFYKRLGLTTLDTYLDPGSRASRALKVRGLPTTVLIDRRGYELGRVAGPVDWDSEAAIGLIRHYLGAPAKTTTAAD